MQPTNHIFNKQPRSSTAGFAAGVHASEARRRAEIDGWRRALAFALACSLPVFLVTMVFANVPGPLQDWVLTVLPAVGITWEELIAWVLATPVQFISGARFYREAYFSLRNGMLGMALLIAMGTSAAYFYSVYVVLYNARLR